MPEPEYLICLNCETPCYVFTWEVDKLVDVFCEVCGSEDIDQFLTQDEFDELAGD